MTVRRVVNGLGNALPAAALAMMVLATVSLASTAPAQPAARLFLSWNAPHGKPRAATSIEAACGDTTTVDTLYLSFDPGRSAPEFAGASANLLIHATAGAELPEFWKARGGGLAGTPLRVVFDSDPERGFVTPWSAQGAGAPFYDVTDVGARLRVIYAIAAGSGPGVKKGQTYGLARVLVRRAPTGSDACALPLCIEWQSSLLGYSRKEQVEVREGPRWVAMHSPDGHTCEPVPAVIGAPKAWKPGAK